MHVSSIHTICDLYMYNNACIHKDCPILHDGTHTTERIVGGWWLSVLAQWLECWQLKPEALGSIATQQLPVLFYYRFYFAS